MEMNHPLTVYKDELNNLQQLVMDLGQMAADQMSKAIQAFTEKNIALADEVIAADDAVNDLEHAIDRSSLLIVTRMEPKSGDLRFILTCGKIASDLERIADYAKNIASRVKRCVDAEYKERRWYVKTMGEEVMNMLQAVMIAFSERNVEKALDVWHADNNVDAIFKEALGGMTDLSEAESSDGSGFISLVFILRCLERVGDHITNVAEHIYYIKYGDHFSARKSG